MTGFLVQLVLLVDETPEPEDVKAGWGALLLFLLLIGAVVFLGFSLTKQLRKAQAAEDAGLYGHEESRIDDESGNDDKESKDSKDQEPHQS